MLNNNIYSQSSIKQILIKYIYETINISSFNYKQLINQNDLTNMKNTKYIAVPCIEGYNYLFVVMKNKDRFYSYLIDRRMLKNTEEQVNIDEIKIIPVDINFSDIRIYDGSIFEGTYHFTKQFDPVTKHPKIIDKMFIINDVYYFNGKSKINDNIINKYIEVKSYINHFHYNDNIKLYLNEYINLSDIEKLENCVDIFKNVKFNEFKINNILGIYFYPYKSGTKLIYNLNNNKNKINNNFNNNKINNNFNNNNKMNNSLNNKFSKNNFNNNYKNKYNNKINENKLNFDNTIFSKENNDNKPILKLTPKIQQYKENLQTQKIETTNYKLINNNIKDIIFTFEFRTTSIEENYDLYLIQQQNNNLYETVFIDYAGVFDIKTSKLCRSFNNNELVDCVYSKNKWIPITKSMNKHPTMITEFQKYFI